MKTINLSELSEPILSFLSDVLREDGAVIKDETGRTRRAFVPYRDPTPEEEQRADVSLEQLRQKTGEAMKKHGVTEEDVMRVLLEDD